MNAVADFYNRDAHDEWARLDRHRTEFAVSMRALQEFLPPPSSKILDIGGGPGRYAFALAEQGYDVTLADLAAANIERAAVFAKQTSLHLTDMRVANACDLSAFPTASYDAVLLFGPLYHLTTAHERNLALQEAHRVLKPNSKIFAAFLINYSALRICAERFPQWLYEHQEYAEKILTTGIHDGEWGFTTAYYVEACQVQPLMEAHGFRTRQLIGSEGIGAHSETLLNALTGDAWEWWADLNYRLGKESALHSAATHLLYVGEKHTQ